MFRVLIFWRITTKHTKLCQFDFPFGLYDGLYFYTHNNFVKYKKITYFHVYLIFVIFWCSIYFDMAIAVLGVTTR